MCERARAPSGRNVKVNDALVAHPTDGFVLGFQHHHGSQLLAAAIALWRSFNRFGSSQLPKNHPLVAVFTLFLPVTYMRPSELLELKLEDLAPSLVPLLPCHSIRIAAQETGGRARTEVREGSVLVDQSCFQRDKILPKIKCGNLAETNWNFDHPAAANLFQTATDALGLSGLTMHPARRREADLLQFDNTRTSHSAKSSKANLEPPTIITQKYHFPNKPIQLCRRNDSAYRDMTRRSEIVEWATLNLPPLTPLLWVRWTRRTRRITGAPQEEHSRRRVTARVSVTSTPVPKPQMI